MTESASLCLVGSRSQSALCSTRAGGAGLISLDALRSLIARGFARGKIRAALLAVSLFGWRGPFLRPGLRFETRRAERRTKLAPDTPRWRGPAVLTADRH